MDSRLHTKYIINTETDQVIKLEPRAMAVLNYLAQKPGQVISRDELIENIWKGRVVSDHAIYRVINQIRKAFDVNDKNAYLVTLPKKGYKLIQPVSKFITQEKQNLETIESSKDNIQNKKLSQPVKYAVLFSLALLGLYSLWVLVLAGKWSFYTTELYGNISPLTSQEDYEDYPAFSNDGKFVIFSSKENIDSDYSLYIKNLANNTVTKASTNLGNYTKASISDEATTIVAVKNPEGSCQVVSLTKIEQDAYTEKDLFSCKDNEYVDIELSSDGKILYYTYADKDNEISRVFSYLMRTGKRTQ